MITGSKTKSQLDAMRQCGQLLAEVLEEIKAEVKVGVSEKQLNKFALKAIKKRGAEATYQTSEVNFPGAICISVNEQVVHSVPSSYKLRRGDVVSFDLVISYKGMKTDSAFTMVVDEEPGGDKKRLLEFTERSLYAGIEAIKGPVRVGDISAAVEKVLNEGDLGIIRELVGHGIGETMHSAPDVPNYGVAGSGPLLVPGETIAIEPMATLGDESIDSSHPDGWTVATADKSLSAHFEHTVLITENGAEILTKK